MSQDTVDKYFYLNRNQLDALMAKGDPRAIAEDERRGGSGGTRDDGRVTITQFATCEIPGCYRVFAQTDKATVTDKNGHGWTVCPECIDGMWQRKPWTPPDDSQFTDYRMITALANLVGAIRVWADLLGDAPQTRGIVKSMAAEIVKAREAYDV